MTTTEKLHDTLTDLHRQLAEVSPADPEVRAMLAQVLQTITETLKVHEAGLVAPADEAVREQLLASARRFEADHPALATTLESLVDVLARMGI